jgi:hypothetical protein
MLGRKNKKMKKRLIALLFCAGVCHAGVSTNSAPDPAINSTNQQDQLSISENPSDTDTQLQIPLGLWKRQLAVHYPSSMKLTVTCRVYRSGILDKAMSSRQVHGTTLPVGTEFLQLGMLDPDAINPGTPRGKVKIFGSFDTVWIDKAPREKSSGYTINIPKTGVFETGKEQLAMELRYGTAIMIASSSTSLPTNAEFRVTLDVRADPLSARETQILRRQSNFNEAFKIDE